MNKTLLLLLGASLAAPGFAADPPTSKNNAQLRKALKAFPQADTDKDGVLTLEEAGPLAASMGLNADDLKTQAEADAGGALPPTFANVPYGRDRRQTLDFWKPESSAPTPVVVLIHGGGFVYGNKADLPKYYPGMVFSLVRQGVAVAAINYRLVKTAPLNESLRDGARAVQFIRSKAQEWNVDKTRIGGLGGSAGGGMCLWLSTRDDLADPASADPVLRESSRLGPVVLLEAQATYDIPRWESFLGPPGYPTQPNRLARAFHLPSDAALDTPAGQAVLRECDMIAWTGPGDGPVLEILTRYGAGRQDTNASEDGYFHSSRHAYETKRVCDEHGIPCEVTADKKTIVPFLLRHLGVTATAVPPKP